MSPFRAAVAFRLMECIILISKFPSEFQLRLRFSLLSLIGRVSDHHNPVEPLGLLFFFVFVFFLTSYKGFFPECTKLLKCWHCDGKMIIGSRISPVKLNFFICHL